MLKSQNVFNQSRTSRTIIEAISVCMLLCTLFISNSTAQQTPYTPAKGSAERKAIMDALRIPVERELGQRVVFVANTLKAQNGWVFLGGKAQKPNGKPIDYSRTSYNEYIEMGMFDDNLFALLRKSGSSWIVVTYAIGCTDVCYESWAKEHGAPTRIFR